MEISIHTDILRPAESLSLSRLPSLSFSSTPPFAHVAAGHHVKLSQDYSQVDIPASQYKSEGNYLAVAHVAAHHDVRTPPRCRVSQVGPRTMFKLRFQLHGTHLSTVEREITSPLPISRQVMMSNSPTIPRGMCCVCTCCGARGSAREGGREGERERERERDTKRKRERERERKRERRVFMRRGMRCVWTWFGSQCFAIGGWRLGFRVWGLGSGVRGSGVRVYRPCS